MSDVSDNDIIILTINMTDDERELIREYAEAYGKRAAAREFSIPRDLVARIVGKRGVCDVCGLPTNTGVVCARCRGWGWQRDDLVRILRDAAERYGERPKAIMFDPSRARAAGHDDWADDHSHLGLPALSTIISAFGSWDAAVRAAGFTPRGQGNRSNSKLQKAIDRFYGVG